jgi:hypothetical protein
VDDDIDERIQEAVEQKVEERLEEERDRIKEEVRRELQRMEAKPSPDEEVDSDRKFTRRGFLKTLGLGAGGLALSGLGASRVTITDKGIKKNGNPLVPFSLGSSKLNDNLNVNGNQIKDQTKTIYNPQQQHIPTDIIQQGSGSGLNADQLDGNQATNFTTNTDLTNHTQNTAAHHTKYTDENAQDAVGNILGSNLNYDNTNNNITLDQERLFGTGNDISLRFDSTADSFRVQDNINTTDIVDIDRSTGDVSISGVLTEGAAL